MSAKPVTREDWASIGQVLASLALHGLFLLVMLMLPDAPLPEPDEEEKIDVEIIPFAALKPPPPASSLDKRADPMSLAEPNQPQIDSPEPDALIRPERMLSSSVLAQANNALARRSLREIPEDERREQLCTLEAMEQLAAWRPDQQPDLVLSYVFEDTRWQSQTLYADGAATMSQGVWYYLSYECTLDQKEGEVTDFAFKRGKPVPKRLWEGFDLIEQVHDTAKGIENYNRKTRNE